MLCSSVHWLLPKDSSVVPWGWCCALRLTRPFSRPKRFSDPNILQFWMNYIFRWINWMNNASNWSYRPIKQYVSRGNRKVIKHILRLEPQSLRVRSSGEALSGDLSRPKNDDETNTQALTHTLQGDLIIWLSHKPNAFPNCIFQREDVKFQRDTNKSFARESKNIGSERAWWFMPDNQRQSESPAEQYRQWFLERHTRKRIRKWLKELVFENLLWSIFFKMSSEYLFFI